MTCKDCIHYDVCVGRVAVGSDKICSYFKDKSRIIELPCGIGDNIFYVHRNSEGNNSIFKVNVLGVVVVIYEDIKKNLFKNNIQRRKRIYRQGNRYIRNKCVFKP